MTTRVSLELRKTWPPETDSQQLAGNRTAFRPSPSHRTFSVYTVGHYKLHST
jgi:hypothetical protein